MPKGAEVKFGTGIRLISDSYFSEPGINHPVMIRLMNKNAKLTVGNNVGISGGGICVQTEVEIGNDVMLGANSFITDTDFHPVGPENRRRSREGVGTKKVTIEDNVFLGMNVIVLKGVTIGKNSIVGAGSVVATDIPPNQIWAGVPAKFVKEIKS
ncbi:acyltransferase [Thermoflexibacter ruber]|nr:acyltransferase [Thermoflexibacter ruber]